MDAQYWHQRWENNEIGFHEAKPNALLLKYWHQLNLAENSRVFIPLCGKTLDIGWFLSQGLQVVGCELNEPAVQALFDQLGLHPQVQQMDYHKCYRAPQLDVWVGNIFDLTPNTLGKIDAIYDRAALVAFSPDMQPQYCQQLTRLSKQAPQLLICFEYDQTLLEGPPFSTALAELESLYGSKFEITSLEQKPVPGDLKGFCPANEAAWKLLPKTQE